MSPGQGPKATPGTDKAPSKGGRSTRPVMDYSTQASSSKATADPDHTGSSKRPLSDSTSSDEKTQHKPERKQSKIVIDSKMDEEGIVEGETVASRTGEQPRPAPGMETEASKEPGQTESSVSIWSRFRTMKSTEDENLGDFVSVLERCLLDQKHLGNRDFMFCMSAYMSRNDMLHKLWQRDDYQRLLSDPRYVTGIAVLFHWSTEVFASIARRLQDSLSSDPNITMRTMQEVCKVKDLEVLAKTAQSLKEAMVADASATALVAAKQNFPPGNPGQPTTQGTSASAQGDSEISNQYNAMQRQRPSTSGHESLENQEENVAYPNTTTTAPIAQTIRSPATGQNSSCLNAHTSGSSSNTSAVGRGRPPPHPNDPSRTPLRGSEAGQPYDVEAEIAGLSVLE